MSLKKNVKALQQRATTVDEKGKDLSVQGGKAQQEKWRVKAISQQETWTVKTILYKEDTEGGAYAAGKSYGLEAKNLEDILRSKNLKVFGAPQMKLALHIQKKKKRHCRMGDMMLNP